MGDSNISRLPQQIGRYQVLGHLATGGMAEILLGRVVAESGFCRGVVLKRILPHLSRLPEFETMFLDEARIVAGIHHPNVVQVFDLGRDGAELFLVMEYLEGESAAGMMRRLVRQSEGLEVALAAHIVAEACCGLHAAHELVDADGDRQNLVHRDVNPKNIFITYDGEVKVLDFGVAKAADRMTRTQAGQVKGTFAYMSPEQCRGKPLDRRSDVFALGVVLYELSTAHRLFKRPTEMLVFKAICTDPIVPPSEVVPGYPAELEVICMKALARDRDARYSTAADMRRDLLAALRKLGPDELPEAVLSSQMRRLFADRIALKQELARKLRSGTDITSVPEAETDLEATLPSVVAEAADASTVATSWPVDPAPRAGAARRIWMLGGLLLLVSLGGVAVASGEFALFAAAGPASVAVSGAAAPTGDPGADESARPSESSGLAASDSAQVVVRLATTPRGARVLIDGQQLGTTPHQLRLKRGQGAVEVELALAGFLSRHEKLVPDRDRRLHFALREVAPRPSPRPPTAPPKAPPGSSSGYYPW